ncbi:MAG: hypothetical protein QJR03_05335 [Sphaerobacter sp.]|nr:hypothetical protein [Sphaerobacter sp.]
MAERFADPVRRHEEPFGWWGYRSEPPAPLSIIELIARGSLDARIAAFLWLAMEQRATVLVVGVPPEAGKTTTLTALLDFLPPEVALIYLRGWYERFTFLDTAAPARSYLLCNEISPHLPTYLWGPGVRRLFEALQAGYGLGATLHAAGAAEALQILTAFPLEVPPTLLTRIDLVLTVGVGSGPRGPARRLIRVELVHDRDGQPEPETIAEREGFLGPLDSRPGRLIGALAARFGFDTAGATAEMARRERFLERLRQDGIQAVDAVREAIRAFRAG